VEELYVEIKWIMVCFLVLKFGVFISMLYSVDALNGEEGKVTGHQIRSHAEVIFFLE
jgi:hypothetical protein